MNWEFGVMNIGYQHGVMLMLLAGGVALWLLAVIAVLGLCRAAAKADENDANRRAAGSVRRRATAGMVVAAAATATMSSLPDDAHARRVACANATTPFERSPSLVREAIGCEIDRVRVRSGLRWLRDNGRLQVAARRHSSDMVRRRYFSHFSPAGTSPGDRARRVGYAARGCSWRIGEVLAWGIAGRSTARATVRAWLNSASHRPIVLGSGYADAGVGTRSGTPTGRRSGVTVTVVVGRRSC